MSQYLNPRVNSFYVDLPDQLVPKSVMSVFDEIALSKFNVEHDSLSEFIKGSVKTFNVPDLSFLSAEQVSRFATNQYPRLAERISQVEENVITIDMRTISGLLNYMILRYAFYLRKFNKEYSGYVGDLIVTVLDPVNGLKYVMNYLKVDFVGISGVSFSYDNQAGNFKDFTLTFTFNDFSMDILHHDISITGDCDEE